MEEAPDGPLPSTQEKAPLTLPLHWLRPPPNIPAGMNPLVLMSLAYALRNSHHPVDPPIKVQRLGVEDYRITDGKHRWMASIVAGRTHIAATED